MDYFGKPWYFRFPPTVQKMDVNDIPGDLLVNNPYGILTPEKTACLQKTLGRVNFQKSQSTYYIDKEIGGKYYILNGQKVQSLVDTVAYISDWATNNIFTSVWD